MRAKILVVEDRMDDEHPDFEHLSDEHLGLEEQLEEMAEHGGCLVRPHDVALSDRHEADAHEAMVLRVLHLGFEVRVEMVLPGAIRSRCGPESVRAR